MLTDHDKALLAGSDFTDNGEFWSRPAKDGNVIHITKEDEHTVMVGKFTKDTGAPIWQYYVPTTYMAILYCTARGW